MPDISMCRDSECPSRESCHRFTAVVKDDGWQSYGNFKRPAGADKCESFIPNSEVKKSKTSSK